MAAMEVEQGPSKRDDQLLASLRKVLEDQGYPWVRFLPFASSARLRVSAPKLAGWHERRVAASDALPEGAPRLEDGGVGSYNQHEHFSSLFSVSQWKNNLGLVCVCACVL